MPGSKRSQEEAIDRVRNILAETLAGVRDKPRHALDLLRFYASERDRLDAAEEVIAGSPDQVKRIMREAEGLLYADPRPLANAHGRLPLLEAWVDVLLVAADRVEREDRWGDAYKLEGAHSDDDFAEASAAEAGSRWQATR